MLFGFPPTGELRDLADAALAAARAAGASYADIRINRYRSQFIFTRDRRVQNIVNTESYGFGVRVIVDGTWGFASSSRVAKDEIAKVARLAADIAKANRRVNGLTRDGLFLIEKGKVTRPVKNMRWNESPVVAYNNIEGMTPSERVVGGEGIGSAGLALVCPAARIREFTFSSSSDAI